MNQSEAKKLLLDKRVKITHKSLSEGNYITYRKNGTDRFDFYFKGFNKIVPDSWWNNKKHQTGFSLYKKPKTQIQESDNYYDFMEDNWLHSI